ncbi:hypothetical protein EYC08_19795 [Tabrizicola sp. WMC-M-20]|nr:hypothetical protein EYC08_19795 [Tabrizicola sp. WMC-M-20]
MVAVARQSTGRGNFSEGAHTRLRRICRRTFGCPCGCRAPAGSLRDPVHLSCEQHGSFVDYGRCYLSGLPISSSRAEGSVDDIANARMGKRRKMRWSAKGAHRVADKRAAVLDGHKPQTRRMTPCFVHSQTLRPRISSGADLCLRVRVARMAA